MKKWTALVAIILLVGVMPVFTGCDAEDPVDGLLVITVMDENNNRIPYEQVFLATSYENLKAGIYEYNGWTDENGQVTFLFLPPKYYYYDTEHWEDYGSTLVYAGLEHYVILYVNTPQP